MLSGMFVLERHPHARILDDRLQAKSKLQITQDCRRTPHGFSESRLFRRKITRAERSATEAQSDEQFHLTYPPSALESALDSARLCRCSRDMRQRPHHPASDFGTFRERQ
jgi:hypothetical protein